MDASGEIARNGSSFARYGNGVVTINDRPWRAEIIGDSEVVVLERDDGGQSHTLYKSAKCLQHDAALGTAAMFLVLAQR